MSKNNTTQITVKLGDTTLRALKSIDPNFPGINLLLDNDLIAMIELNDGKIRTVAYNKDSDLPINITNWEE